MCGKRKPKLWIVRHVPKRICNLSNKKSFLKKARKSWRKKATHLGEAPVVQFCLPYQSIINNRSIWWAILCLKYRINNLYHEDWFLGYWLSKFDLIIRLRSTQIQKTAVSLINDKPDCAWRHQELVMTL